MTLLVTKEPMAEPRTRRFRVLARGPLFLYSYLRTTAGHLALPDWHRHPTRHERCPFVFLVSAIRLHRAVHGMIPRLALAVPQG